MNMEKQPAPQEGEPLEGANQIRHNAEGIPEFAAILAILSDEEIVQLDNDLRGTGSSEGYTLKGLPAMHKRTYKIDVDWKSFQEAVEQWREIKLDPNAKEELATQNYYLGIKRDKAAKKIIAILDRS
jgi:hypothetical protein